MELIQVIIASIGIYFFTTGAIALADKERKEHIPFFQSCAFKIIFGLTLSEIAIKVVPCFF